MIEYYRDPQVRVTSDVIRVDGRAYRLAELARIWHQRGHRSWSSLAGRGALGGAMLVPVALAIVAITLAITIDASTATTIALIGGAILFGLAALPLADFLLDRLDRSYDRGTRRLEIWADVRGTPTLLLGTDDRLRFGRIYRALQRAVEHAEPAHGGPRRLNPGGQPL